MLKEADRQSDGTALRERTGVQSLERAFAILEAIASRPEGISLAEFSKQVGLHSSTAYHLVRSMGSGAFQLRESHGGVRPGHATALGKILLAALDPPQLERYLQAHKLEA